MDNILNEYVFHYNYGNGKIIQIDGNYAIIEFETGEQTVDLTIVLKNGILQFKNPHIDKSKIIAVLKNSERPFTELFNQKELDEIVDKYQQDFLLKKDLPFVVKKSIPIIWFGDIEKYFLSKKKIVSVGLNPSDKEFTVKRFKETSDFKKQLNEYFEFNPYRNWFQWFENVLNPLNASYNGKMCNTNYENTAIHIDIYSAIATNPTFGQLTMQQKELLSNNLFLPLLKFLNPDIILFSANKKILDEYFSDYQIDHDVPYQGIRNMFTVYKKGNKLLIRGRNMRGIPFGGMSKDFLHEQMKNIN